MNRDGTAAKARRQAGGLPFGHVMTLIFIFEFRIRILKSGRPQEWRSCMGILLQVTTFLVSLETNLNSVEVYAHEKSNKNQIRGGNKSYDNGVVVYLTYIS